MTPFGRLIEAPHLPTDLRAELAQHRLLVLRGFEPFPTTDALAAYARTFGPLLEWDFGTVFEVVERANPNNYLFTSGSVPYHWDGAFAAKVPWLQVFQCLESPGPDAGGETLFCDGVKLVADLPPAERAAWERVTMSYATEKVSHYGGRIAAPLVGRHPLTGEAALRFNEPANESTVRLNTPEVEVTGASPEQGTALIERVRALAYDPRYVYRHQWRPGDRVIADNFALLHGRSPYCGGAPRRLWRVHVLAEDVQ